MILKKLQLFNFKCFKDHIINFNETTIIIGENNAGKSTVVEALRLLGLACARLRNSIIYNNRPTWLKDKPLKTKGVDISSKAIDVELECVFNQLSDPPSILKAFFENNLIIEIYIYSERQIYAFCSMKGDNLKSHDEVLEAGLPNIYVLPQIVPLRKEESYTLEKTILNNRFSKRTSRNFRNSLLLKKDTKEFKSFEKLIEETWGSIEINDIYKNEESKIILLLKDRDFTTEIFNMGHGVQMWLQTMWFITCVEENSIIVLDEPDVYMHADLQRKLIRLLKRDSYGQTIIATHSVEIMSEVQPGNILIVNRKKEESIFANDYPVLQAAISSMGSIHNIGLARILNNKKYIYVEGDDKELLNIIYEKIFIEEEIPLDHIASITTGGWGSWDLQKNNAKELTKEMKDLVVFFLYDRDYHTDEEVEERNHDSESCQLNLHIWCKKEIENYLIIPSTIARLIHEKDSEYGYNKLADEIEDIIDDICEHMKEHTLDTIISEAKKTAKYKKEEYTTIKAKLRPHFDKKWETFDGKTSLVSGKIVLSQISDIFKTKYGVSFGPKQIALCLDKNEIPEEIKMVLKAIKNGVSFTQVYINDMYD